MRLAPCLLIFLLLLLLPSCSLAERNAVLVIVDGLGASYLYPDLPTTCVDGTPLEKAHLRIMDRASALYTLKVPVPKTEYGHAVIATGYSGADDETLTYYDATIFDSLRRDGYLCIAVMETGDSSNMVAEQDAIVHDANNSPVTPDLRCSGSDVQVPAGIRAILGDNPPLDRSSSKAKTPDYPGYDNWSLKKAVQLVDYLNSTCPGQKYLLTVNVAGTDEASHESGYASYLSAVSGLDPGLSALASACRSSGTLLIVTADHGMSFKTRSSKGAHASADVSARNESLLIPLMVFTDRPLEPCADVSGQECVAPTLLSLMGCNQYLSVGDGEALPWNDRPALQIVADRPENVTISGPGMARSEVVNGTLRLDGLEKGVYRLESPAGAQEINLTRDTVVQLAVPASGKSDWPVSLLFCLAAALAVAGLAAALKRQR